MNPHDLVGGARNVWWGDLEIGNPIELEMIDYFKADSYRFARGFYVIYYAEAAADYAPLGIFRGDAIVFHLSFRCYVQELKKLKNEHRIPCQRKFAEGKNLYIKFERVNKERIRIYSQEPREPTEEQIREASVQYDIIRQEHKGR